MITLHKRTLQGQVGDLPTKHNLSCWRLYPLPTERTAEHSEAGKVHGLAKSVYNPLRDRTFLKRIPQENRPLSRYCMIYETATSTDSRPINRITLLPRPDPEHEHRDEIQKQVMEILLIEREIAGDDTHVQTNLMVLLGNNIRVVVGYEGQLLIDSETAYAKLDDALKGIQHFAVFRELNGKHFIFILNGRVDPQPRSWVPNLLLFLATLVSVLIVGTQIALNELIHNQPELLEPLLSNFWGELWRGAPYAISILLILGAHELGHYFAARYHKIAVTLPYFIPAPLISLLGTFGAFIQIREPMRNRKVLLDIGVAGPLAGLVFCIPILLIGLATSQTGPISVGGQVEGNSILYALSKILVFGQFLPNGEMDVYVNQLAWAGWTGLHECWFG